jgi:phosphotransferase system enzyme I (PtsI)
VRTQVRAIARAAAHGPVEIMYPMVADLRELDAIQALVRSAFGPGEWESRGIREGAMIEVPSIVFQLDAIAPRVQFFSIGTNDLIQYTLAVDRNNRKVAPMYEPLHPAVLRAINYVARAAIDAGKPVSICGEMAADPMCTLALVGIGLQNLSMGPFFVPVIKRLVRAVDFRGAQRLAQEALNLATVKEVKGLLFEGMRELGVIDVIETYH